MKIPKGYSESVNRRRTDNTMTKRKGDKRTNNEIQNTHIKLKLTLYEDTKGVFRLRKSKKNRQHNGQKKRDKRTNNDLQNLHIKLTILKLV